MAEIVGPPPNAIRCRPIADELEDLLNGAADATGIDRIVIVSGGQTSNHAAHLEGVPCGWTGSRRHDNGRAADIELIRDGNTLTFTDSDGSQVAQFVTACAARGATGIGAGVHYMGRKRIHVGFGSQAVWGASGLSANAPAWLRTAAQEGWNNPVAEDFAPAVALRAPGRSVVMARGGLWLRKGPGLKFGRARLLDEGTALTVVGLDGDWARVDLEGEGPRFNGYVLASFLGSADSGGAGDPGDGLEEPIDEEAVVELVRADPAAGARGRARRGSRPAPAA